MAKQDPTMTDENKPERIAKRMARAGLCSRRDAEQWIADGRVAVNGKVLQTPAFTVSERDRIEVDGNLLQTRERTRLWLFHKPAGLVTTNKDPEGRRTVFSALPASLPRVMSVGRLDINTEGLLLLTNDGGLARALELPTTGWLRRYRVRAHGKVTQEQLDALRDGIAVEGVLYGSIEAAIERVQGSNVWLAIGLREGKNREIKKVLSALDLTVNRLIRVSYGPFQLADLPEGTVREIRGRTLRDQLGEKLIAAAGADFDAPILNEAPDIARKASAAAAAKPAAPVRKPVRDKHGQAREEALDRLDTRPRHQPGERPGDKRGPKPKGGGRDADRRR